MHVYVAQTAVGGVAASGKADFVSTIQSHNYNHFCEYQKKNLKHFKKWVLHIH